MNATKKLTAWLLAAVMAASALSACSNGDDSGSGETDRAPTTTAPIEETEADTRIYPTHLPEDVTYGGYDFRMAHYDLNGSHILDLDSDEENGDLINDAIFRRNTVIEEKYGVNLSATYVLYSELNTQYRNMISSSDNTYDVVFVRAHESSSLVQNGYFLDLYNLEHIDWNMPWWDQRAVAELSIGNRLLMTIGDITLTDKQNTACTYFNKQLQRDYELENFYDLVENGKWTWDKMIDIAKNVREDLDGNSIWDENDLWGIGDTDSFTFRFLHAGGGRYASKDENDMPIDVFGEERTLTVAQRVLDIIFDDSYFYYGGGMNMFEEGKLLFHTYYISSAYNMREFEDYGIIPNPKFDEAQENYYSAISIHGASVLTVPKTIPEESYDRTGLILEALAAESKYTVINVYYDTVLKVKGTRDEQSVAMLDMIFNNRTYDLGEFYQFGSFNGIFLRARGNNVTEIASQHEKNAKKIQKGIEKLVKVVEEYE